MKRKTSTLTNSVLFQDIRHFTLCYHRQHRFFIYYVLWSELDYSGHAGSRHVGSSVELSVFSCPSPAKSSLLTEYNIMSCRMHCLPGSHTVPPGSHTAPGVPHCPWGPTLPSDDPHCPPGSHTAPRDPTLPIGDPHCLPGSLQRTYLSEVSASLVARRSCAAAPRCPARRPATSASDAASSSCKTHSATSARRVMSADRRARHSIDEPKHY